MSPRKPVPTDESSNLSLTQIAASAAAASSAAFAASYLGVAGTIIGAAVASVIATVATSMYSASLHRSREAVRRTAGQLGTTWVVPSADGRAEPEAPRETAAPGFRWGQALTAAAAVLAITLGALTGVEAVFGKPLSTLVDGSDGGGTSLTSVTGGDRSEQAEDRAPTGQPTPTPSAEPTPPAQPTEQPTEQPTGQPTEEPTGQPTEEPTGQPTGTPSADPTPSPTDTPTPTHGVG